MKYKVSNLKTDMKFMKDGVPTVIKRGESLSVSVQDYQYLAQVYGMSVKGEKDYTVRVTVPVEIEVPVKTETPKEIVEPKSVPTKKRKNKKR